VPARAFAPYPGSVPAARDYVVAMLDHLPADRQETAALLTSELATNAVRHGGGQDFEVSVQYLPGEDRLWVGVTDTGAGNPLVRRPPVTAEHGRGLQLVGLFADRWGVRRRRGDHAKTVWFELSGGITRRQPHEPARPVPEPSS
jgi:anti-sigma regulatory factor (Ser/Thr protein kinase)